MFKQFFTFRYSLSPNGRHNTLLVYADSPEVAEDKAIKRLRADYPKGFTLFPQGRKVFATAEEADRACANGFFGSISQFELAEFLCTRAGLAGRSSEAGKILSLTEPKAETAAEILGSLASQILLCRTRHAVPNAFVSAM